MRKMYCPNCGGERTDGSMPEIPCDTCDLAMPRIGEPCVCEKKDSGVRPSSDHAPRPSSG